MSPERAGAAYPNALSFSRTLVRKMVRERWRIEAIRINLDSDGRGEALYRIAAGEWHFHFFAISSVFPPNQKVDRAFGVNWDVSAAICQGEWTSDREKFLGVEIPKQYDGRYDPDVLCFCRGNRSERIFDHVVDALAVGAQPDVALLTTVGYVLRSTAFAGNGLFGMRPFDGLEPDHPLGAPYHVQILAAYMLRTFVFDLIDHLAAARGGTAAKLDRRLKRYLGVGNSAGLGLIPFAANHPQIIHRWCLTHEEALAAARSQLATPRGHAALTFLSLLERAVRYFRQDQRDGNGIFASYERLASDMEEVLIRARFTLGGECEALMWAGVMALLLPCDAHAETVEIVNGLLLELYPDIVAAHEGKFEAVERIDVDATMRISDLRKLAHQTYGWLLDGSTVPQDATFFWYYPVESPYEPRRGRRGRNPASESETPMDMPLKLRELMRVLEEFEGDPPVAILSSRHPDLWGVVARIQSLAGCEYGELRLNTLSKQFIPFASCRFLLAFYGMEKYDPRPPRSTKGALLQGAPIADEIASGVEGDWPFPLAPELGSAPQSDGAHKFIPLRLMESPEIPIEAIREFGHRAEPYQSRSDGSITVFPAELRKLLTRAAVGAGLASSAAEAYFRMALFCQMIGCGELGSLSGTLEAGIDQRPRMISHTQVDGCGAPAFLAAPMVLDLACGQALRSAHSVAARNVIPSPLLPALPYWAALREFVAILVDPERNEVIVSGPGTEGPWLIKIGGASPEWALTTVSGLLQPLAVDEPDISSLLARSIEYADTRHSFSFLCMSSTEDLYRTNVMRRLAPDLDAQVWSEQDIAQLIRTTNRIGLPLGHDQYEALSCLAKRGLVSASLEPMLLVDA